MKVQLEEKTISDEAKKLRESLKEVVNTINEIKSFNAKGGINNYCDRLQFHVMDMVDSTVKYINKQRELLI